MLLPEILFIFRSFETVVPLRSAISLSVSPSLMLTSFVFSFLCLFFLLDFSVFDFLSCLCFLLDSRSSLACALRLAASLRKRARRSARVSPTATSLDSDTDDVEETEGEEVTVVADEEVVTSRGSTMSGTP